VEIRQNMYIYKQKVSNCFVKSINPKLLFVPLYPIIEKKNGWRMYLYILLAIISI